MFICDSCHAAIGPGVPENRSVVASRPREYLFRAGAQTNSGLCPEPGIDGPRKCFDDHGGRGWEIVRESKLCPQCAVRGERNESQQQHNI